MDRIASALGDDARWRIVELLAERPRAVGELAELAGLRQPQTTKHLQTLARAGLVTVFPLGQRRVCAVETAPLRALERRLRELAETAEAHAGERDVIARYRAAIEAESASTGRRVTASMSLTLDGRYNGPGGPGDLSAIVPYMTTGVAREQLTRIWEGATTALLGRLNAEGFIGFWSPLAEDENVDPRDRGYAKWLVDTEKVVLSTTLTEAPWPRTRIVNAPAADVVSGLKATGEGDILINNSASVIKPLLSVDLIDRLYLIICPEIAGGGQRLFDDGLPASKWTLTHQETGELGEIAMVYDRAR